MRNFFHHELIHTNYAAKGGHSLSQALQKHTLYLALPSAIMTSSAFSAFRLSRGRITNNTGKVSGKVEKSSRLDGRG